MGPPVHAPEDVEEEEGVELEVDVFSYFALKVLSLNSGFRARRVGKHQHHTKRELLRASCIWGLWALVVHIAVFIIALILIDSVTSESLLGFRKTAGDCDATEFTMELPLNDYPLSHRMIGATCLPDPARGGTAASCDAAWNWLPQELDALQKGGHTFVNADPAKSLDAICKAAGCRVEPIKDACQVSCVSKTNCVLVYLSLCALLIVSVTLPPPACA